MSTLPSSLPALLHGRDDLGTSVSMPDCSHISHSSTAPMTEVKYDLDVEKSGIQQWFILHFSAWDIRSGL